MARKPKTQPNPEALALVPMPEFAAPNEAAVPARRGRKPKAAALSSGSPSTVGIASPAADDAATDVLEAGPTKTSGRRGAGRKPKQAAGAEPASPSQDGVAGPEGQAPRQSEAEASVTL